MQTRKLGQLDVTVVGIGCNNFGRQLDAAATRTVIEAALDHGITFFDTADSYGRPMGSSESFLGDILKPHRNRVVISSKFGRKLEDGRRGAKPAYVRSATEDSLRRLQTDRIDLMQLHIPDPDTPIEDTLGALADLMREGKIREIGCSNLSAPELAAMNRAAAAAGLPCFISVQDELSMLHRRPSQGLLAECAAQGLAFLPFRPLFNGLLTGKYATGAPADGTSRIGAKSEAAQAAILSPANLAAVAALTDWAQARGRTILELAFGWLLAHPQVPSVIAGVSSARQVALNAGAAGWTLTGAERAEVDSLLEQYQAQQAA